MRKERLLHVNNRLVHGQETLEIIPKPFYLDILACGCGINLYLNTLLGIINISDRSRLHSSCPIPVLGANAR